MDCFYCAKDQRLLDLMIPLAEMTTCSGIRSTGDGAWWP